MLEQMDQKRHVARGIIVNRTTVGDAHFSGRQWGFPGYYCVPLAGVQRLRSTSARTARSSEDVGRRNSNLEDERSRASFKTSYKIRFWIEKMEDEEMVDVSEDVQSKKDLKPRDNLPLLNGCPDNWTWNKTDKSHEVKLYGPGLRIAHFHPDWSNGTAGVRGTRTLNRGRYYWEINVSQRIFGTSMMFGIATKKARLHIDNFVNMLGEDEHGWGLSHKGLLWHNGRVRLYAKPFRENEATTVGLHFDGIEGTLTYYKDGECLGVAFTGLHLVEEELYPVVCSTAAKTEMSLGVMKREFGNLQDRCRATILTMVRNENDLQELQLPNCLKMYIADGMDKVTIQEKQCREFHHPYFTRSRGDCERQLAYANFLYV